ncbi:MAG: DUF3124 domain-containing protein [Thiohalocapsa sp.]
MQNDEHRPVRSHSRRELIKTAAATIAVMILIVVLGLVANRLHDLEQQLAFRAPVGLGAGAKLSVDVVAKGRAVYVPAYSHIYARGGEASLLEITLSVRNTDPEQLMRIDRVGYFDNDGNVVRELAATSIVLGPMQTASYLVEEQEADGGAGANFVVEWSAQQEINRPIIEAVMIGDGGLSFASRGEPIERR